MVKAKFSIKIMKVSALRGSPRLLNSGISPEHPDYWDSCFFRASIQGPRICIKMEQEKHLIATQN